MKLIRHGAPGAERPGAIDAHGVRRDLSALLPDLAPDWLAPARLAQLRGIDLTALPVVADDVRLGPPLAGVRQFLGIGLNYRKHAIESGKPIPQQPVLFTKAIGAVAGPDDDLALPPGSTHTDWEVELGFVIGSTANGVDPASALRHVAGYFLANDVSERDWQMNRGGQWTIGKGYDGFGPIGPWLLTADELPDPQNVPLRLWINGEWRQDGHTSDMIFGVAQIVSYLSHAMTLRAGDIVITGTPAGVGLGMNPPTYLKAGDVIRLDGGPLGCQQQRVV